MTTKWTRLADAYGLLVAATLAYFMFGLVIQVSDSFVQLLSVQTPTLGELLSSQFSQRGYLRPLLWAQLKVVYELADGQYYLWFRTIQVVQVLLLIVLYVRVLRPTTMIDAALVPVSLAVLVGAHTFVPLVREAFPINGMLTVEICCLAIVILAHRARPNMLLDALAIVMFLASLLIVETGILIWVTCAAAYALGARGISKAGVLTMTGCLIGYLVMRSFVLDIGSPGLVERASGFGFSMLEPSDLVARFGDSPWVFYAYNVLSSISTVLFAEPKGGVWRFVFELTTGTLHPWTVVSVASSTAATALVVWFAWQRRGRVRAWTFDDDDRLVWIFVVVLGANAVISFPYTKSVIMSPAGVFFGLAVTAAARAWLRDLTTRSLVPTFAIFAVLTCGWAFRVVGNHYNMRWTAAEQRAAWVAVDEWLVSQRIALDGADGRALRDTLRHDALRAHPTPYQPTAAWMRWFDIDF